MNSKFAEPLLRIEGLNKRYGKLHAVRDVNLAVYPGEILALLGPNGAGKTTLIGCVAGIVRGFTGKITIGRHDVVRNYRVTRQLIGVVPQELNFDAFFSTRQVLGYQGGFFGRRRARERLMELLKAFSLEDKADANSRWLSGGMKRRLMICKALMHEPAILFLDEPTAGVDVELREELWAYVRDLRALGTTVVLTTHYLEEAEQLADRIAMIRDGRIILVERRNDLLDQYGKRWVEMAFQQTVDPALFQSLAEVEVQVPRDRMLRFSFHDSSREHLREHSSYPAIHRILQENGLVPLRVEGGRSNLEEIFRTVMKQQKGLSNAS